jgi:hypothetical protein
MFKEVQHLNQTLVYGTNIMFLHIIHRFKRATLNKQINDLESFFRRSTNESDQPRIVAAVGSSFKHHFLKQNFGQWLMFKNIILVLTYYRQKF